tara:strand:- start:1844 stop:3418 length:1575 start_codon:yes stop_codon:yes gene_type:complete
MYESREFFKNSEKSVSKVVMPNDLNSEIHSNFSSGSSTWANFRSEVTGMYILSGQNGEDGRQHLLREYNRKINELNQTGGQFYLEPFNGGFSYLGTPDLYTGSNGAYSTRRIGFGGYLMKVRSNFDYVLNEEAYVKTDANNVISMDSPLDPTGTIPDYQGTVLWNQYESRVPAANIKSFVTGIRGKKYKVTYTTNHSFEHVSGFQDYYKSYNLSWWTPNSTNFLTNIVVPNVPQTPEGEILYYPFGQSYFGFISSWVINTKAITGSDGVKGLSYYTNEARAIANGSDPADARKNFVLQFQPLYDSLGEWVGTGDACCSVWYDQSQTGSAQNNLTQTTAADQPLLVNQGTLVTTSSGDSSLDFNGSTHHMTLNTGFSSTLNINALSSYTVFQADTIAGTQMVSTLGSFADSNKRWYAPFISSNNFSFNYGAGSAPSTSANTNLNLVSMVADSTQGAYKAFLNSSQVGSDGSLEDKSGGTALVGVGGLADSLHYNGKMGEFIIYSSSTESANRTSIETDIKNHFKI